MGLNMSGFSVFRKLNLKLPWSACSVKNKPKTPFLIGVLNGLMPCGPLQTMQLYALGTGSALCKISTDKLIHKATSLGAAQTSTISGVGYELDPVIVVVDDLKNVDLEKIRAENIDG